MKNDVLYQLLYNRMGDQWINDCSFKYIDKDIFKITECEVIMQFSKYEKLSRGN